MNNGVAIVNGSRVLRILKYAVAFLLFSLVIISSTFKINDPDTMYYMAHGKYILQHGWRDYSSVYVYSSPNADVCFPEWFFHVMTYAVYAIGRWNGLVIFQILLVLAIFTVIFKNSINSKYSFFSTAIFILLAVLVGMERFMLRADTFGILMAVSFYFILKKHMERGFLAAPYRHIRPLAMLLVIQMLWANTHPSFPLGLIIASAFLGNELFNPLIEAFVHRRRAVFSVKKVKFLGFLLFGCVAVSSFNPYGPGAFFWPFRFLFGSSLLHSQLEWASTFAANDVQHLSVTMYKVMFFGALTLLAIDFKHVKLIDALILIPFFYLSARYVRNLAIFAFFSALILPAYLDNIAFRLENAINKKNIIQRIRLPFKIIICVTLIFIIIKLDYGVITNKLYIRDQRSRRFGFGVSELIYPVKAADFILQNNLKGRLFNDYGTGDYFDWRLFPKYQTFIDGHSHTFDLFDYYAKVMAGIIPYQAAVDRYKINFFILNHIFPDTPQLIAQLHKDKNWVPVYFDELSVIFIADKPENKSIINKYAIDFSSDKNFDPERLVAIYDKVDYPVARLNRGIFFNNIGLFEKAAHEFEKAVEEDPSFYAAYS
ncbi:MAG: hypothetical protein ACM3IL_04660, partial [Deltaproteobacteria bacterium]